ncbi:MAG: polysaccharide pyruvyl transferase family protein [Phycisphaerales bacterium]|nr:MAG: polysaccharide pyruvyl transferase family protein [Phycisphaerales bacterium]
MTDKDHGPLFILAGNGSYFNRGCEGILRGTVEILRHYFDAPKFVAVTSYKSDEQFRRQRDQESDPAVVHEKMHKSYKTFDPLWFAINGLRIVCPHVLRHIVYKDLKPYLPEARAVLALGGDNYSLDYTKGPLWLTKGPVVCTELDELAVSHHKPLIIWGSSVGPFSKSPSFERYMIEHLRKVHIFARETATVEYLAGRGLTDNVHRVADPAFVMSPQEPPERIEIPEGSIGLNLSPLMARFATGGDLERWKDLSAQIINRLTETTDRPLYLIPHVVGGLGNDDHRFLEAVLTRPIDKRDRIALIGPTFNAPQTKWIVSRMAVFAGARMHSTIAALSSCVPTLSFSYSMKSKGVNQDVYGHTDYCLMTDQLTPDVVVQRIAALLQDHSAVRAQLQRQIPVVKQLALKSGELLKTLVPPTTA